MREDAIKDRIRLALSETLKLHTFVNTNGMPCFGKFLGVKNGIAQVLGGRPKPVGWGPGSHDLLGWHSVVITPQMVGHRIAVLVGIEVKRPGEKPEPHQEEWHQLFEDAGAISGWTTSPEGAVQIVRDWEDKWKA